MQLQKDTNPALNTVTAYGDDYIEINKTRHHQSIYFMAEGPVNDLNIQKSSDFTTELLQNITGVRPAQKDPMAFLDGTPNHLENTENIEVLLIGTGRQQQFLHPAITSSLLSLRIGVEIMDTQAAARTYNILMSEGRRVVAALIL